jgi:hypothetical protein
MSSSSSFAVLFEFNQSRLTSNELPPLGPGGCVSRGIFRTTPVVAYIAAPGAAAMIASGFVCLECVLSVKGSDVQLKLAEVSVSRLNVEFRGGTILSAPAKSHECPCSSPPDGIT